MPLTAGSRLGPYEIVAPLGAGGMGEVYRARDTRLGRDVAVKVLPQHLSSDPAMRARFEREARTISSFNHAHICTLHDIGHENGTDYLVMELLQGETLAQRLARGPLPLAEVLTLGAQIADALDRAHRAGVVHRDLKPANVMLTRSGAKLMDFGLARGTGLEASSDRTMTEPLTAQGTILGTFQYMAPEQLEGQPGDQRSDLWALGCVLYEMATGRRAFEGKSQASLITAIMGSEPAPMSQLAPLAPLELERLVHACLTKDPAERIQSAHDVKLQLGWVGAPPAAPERPPARKRSVAIASGLVAAALLAGALAGYLGRGRSSPASAGVADVTYTPVTFEEGFVFAARFAADGRTIVYSADWDGQPRDVFVTSLGSPEFRPLGYPGADLLAVSRAGEIAILSGSTIIAGPYRRLGTLARASLTGGAARPEVDSVHFADFGAGGALAVVRNIRRRQTLEYPLDQVLVEHPIFERSAFSQLSHASVSAPRISPNGNHVAAFDGLLGAYTVKVFDRSGKLATVSPACADWWGLAWRTPTEIWYAAALTAGEQSIIFALGLDGTQRVVYRAPSSFTLHDVSEQGDVLVSFDPPGGSMEILGEDPVPLDRRWREGGVLRDLSDAHVMLFSTVESGGPHGSVFVWHPGERRPVRIAEGAAVALSPDGKRALVTTPGTPPRASIVPTGAGRPEPLELGELESLRWAGWLPDGRLVIEVVRAGGKTAVEIVSPDGTKAVTFLPEGATLRGGRLISPDGSRIVALSADERLEVCTLASSGCRPLAGALAGDEVAGWTADGKAVFVYRSHTDSAKVDRLDVDSGARSAWKTVQPMRANGTGIAWLVAAPDGALAYSYSTNRSQLYVIHGLK